MRLPVKICIATILGLVAIEGGAIVAVRRLHPAGVLESAAFEAARGGAGFDGATETDEEEPEIVWREQVHPYLGFLSPVGVPWSPGSVMSINQPELYWPGSPLLEDNPSLLLVGITGGSVSASFTSGGGAAVLRDRLGAIPRFAGRTPCFVSLNGGGVKQPQQLMSLEWLLVQGLRLDVLINLDGFNEVALHEIENEPFGVAPIYPRSWRLMLGPKEHSQILGERAYIERRRRELAAALLRSPLRWSHVSHLVWIFRDRQLGNASRAIEAYLAEVERARPDRFVSHGPRPPDSTLESRRAEMVDIWRRGSLQLERSCRVNGIEYFHFLQPNQYVEGSKPISEEEARLAITSHRGYGSAVPGAYPLLRAAGTSLVAEGVRFLDLTDVFRDHPETIYVDDCCHVNPHGNTILGHAVADAIASWGD
jgi:hypothetical protein